MKKKTTFMEQTFLTAGRKINFTMKKLQFLLLLFLPTLVVAQERIEPIKFGDMEQWLVRYIKESRLLGGKTKTL